MRYVTLLLIFLGIFSFASAQSGTLTGLITDAENNQPLNGASIRVVGTYLGGLTDAKGNFRIQGIKPGDYSVIITYIGYAEREYNGIRIVAGSTQNLQIALNSSVSTLGEVEIVGQRTLIDLESGKSGVNIGQDQISQMGVTNVQEVAARQLGVNLTPDGLQIRGGRVYETEYVVDGVSAQDPLSGTGFGVEVNSAALQNLEVITGGAEAEYGNGTSGVVSARIREGGKRWTVNGNYRRDNLGFNVNQGPSWNTDEADISMGGPIIKKKLTLFLAGSAGMTDQFFRSQATQLQNSMLKNPELWAPRYDNKYTGTFKLAYTFKPGLKFTLTQQNSLAINQNTRTLQVVGNDQIVTPGFQFPYSLNLDNANTYLHRTSLTVLAARAILGPQWTTDVTLGRLFVNLRADANGRPFRTETVDQLYDPASIVTDPVTLFNPGDTAVYVFPGPGLINNGGIATVWHDHYVNELSAKVKFNYQSKTKVHYMTFGWEHKEQEYQWIDVARPWVGAAIQINDSLTTPATSLGSSSDLWRVRPATGGWFYSDEIRYKGIIASLGFRLNYWAPGKFVDDAVANPDAPVLDAIREQYADQTFGFLDRNWKARLLPRIRVSFPVTENNVLYFNYNHAMRLPHPRFVYAGLDPVFQDRSFLANLGNPNLNPEVSVAYELGLKSQINRDLAASFTAFYSDRFDYIVTRAITVRDQTGRFVEKSFYINQDYARIRGAEVSLTGRMGKWLMGSVSGAYQIATGKSNTAAESALQIRQNGFVNATKEQYLAWDRPFEFKGLLIFTPDSTIHIGRMPLRGFRATLSANYNSGLRYTPYNLVGVNDQTGRPEYEPIETQPYAKVGKAWFWLDFRLSRDFFFGKYGRASVFFEVKNLTDYKSPAIINPVTGKGYENGDPVPLAWRDPYYPDPQDRGTPPNNPARYLAPRHMFFGVQFAF